MSLDDNAQNNNIGFANPVQNVAQFGIEDGMKVVDLGSGAGHYVLAMAPKVGSAGRVYAVDVQKDLLEKIKNEATTQGFENVEIIWGDIERIEGSKIGGGIIDIALISNTLFQVENKIAVMREAHRILKPKGKMIVIDWSESFGGLGPVQADLISKEHAIDTARTAGFGVEGEFDAGEHHYGIIFNKV